LKALSHRPEARELIRLFKNQIKDSEEQRDYVAAAREKHAHQEGDVEVDEDAIVSIGHDGAYVQAWTWVPKEA
jgi:hypothetical protein